MQTRTAYFPAALGSPIRGYHSSGNWNDDHVFPTIPGSHQHAAVRRLTSSGGTPASEPRRSLGSVSDDKTRHSSLSSPQDLDAEQCSVEYLASLMKEQKQLALFPKMFAHVEQLLEEEIARVHDSLFQNEFAGSGEQELPDPVGPIVTITEKLYVPVHEFPEYNFVGRLLGPRGMTAKQLEHETRCRIMVRGKGSIKDRRKEEAHRGRPNWEHLDDDLHVLVQCEDTENRCRVKLTNAMRHVRRLLIPAPDGTDELKRKQLVELAIINGTYRPPSRQANESVSRTSTPLPTSSPSSEDSERSPSPLISPDSHFLKSIRCNYPGVSHLYGLGMSLLDPLNGLTLSDTPLPNMQPSSPYQTSDLVNLFPDLFMHSYHDGGDSGSTSPRCSED